MGASRLPGKMMMELGGKPLLKFVVDRVIQSNKIDRVIIATTTSSVDDVTEKFCQEVGLEYFRGSENDVLDRFYQCAQKYPEYDYIVRITGDCPFADYRLINQVIDLLIDNKADYASNVLPLSYPDGLDVEVFTKKVLTGLWQTQKDKYHREHVTSYIRDNQNLFKIVSFKNDIDLSNLRLTIDYPEDLQFARRLLEYLSVDFQLADILEVLDNNFDLKNINSNHEGHDSWKDHCQTGSGSYKNRELFLPDDFSDSNIKFHRVDFSLDFIKDILDKYFVDYKIIDILQHSRLERNSQNFQVRLKINGEEKKYLLRKYLTLKDREQIDFYLGSLVALAGQKLAVSTVVRTKDNNLSVEVGQDFYSLLEFIPASHFSPCDAQLSDVARQIANMHNAFNNLDSGYKDKIKNISQSGYTYFNEIKEYDVSSIEAIENIISRQEESDINILVKSKIPAIKDIITVIKNNSDKINQLSDEIIHSDLHPHNVLIVDDQVKAIIDFDAVRISQQARDVAFAIYRFGRQFLVGMSEDKWQIEAKRVKEVFLESYSKVKNISNQELELMPLLIRDEFIRKILFVLKGIYQDGNDTWAKDLPKFLVALAEIDYFFPILTYQMDKKEKLKEILKYIPSGAQTLSKNPTQYVVGVTPPVVSRAKGVYLYDEDGNKYLDMMLALGPMVLGYANEQIDNVVKSQIDLGTIYSLPSNKELELAKLLRQVVPNADMSRFVLSGNEATSGAIRLARHITGRDHIAKCGYHGCQDWSICTKKGRNAGVPEIIKTMTHDFQYNDIKSLEQVFNDFPDQIAAVILEPASSVKPIDNFLEQVKELAHQNGALLIFDEMVTGFRWALGGAQEYYGVTADLACFSKAISNGYPLAVICGKREYMKKMDEVFVSMTYAGFIPGLVAAIETIKIMQEKGNVHKYIYELGDYLIGSANKIAKKHNLPFEFVGYGPHPVMKINIDDDAVNRLVKTYIYQEMNQKNILFSSSMMISYYHTKEQIDEVLGVYDMICRQIKEQGDYNNLINLLVGDIVAPRAVRNIQ